MTLFLIEDLERLILTPKMSSKVNSLFGQRILFLGLPTFFFLGLKSQTPLRITLGFSCTVKVLSLVILSATIFLLKTQVKEFFLTLSVKMRPFFMNVLESTNLLFDWFSKEDTFELSNDFNKLILVSLDPERDKASLLLSLQDLKSKNIILDQEYDGKTYWIVKQPFVSYSQDVEISSSTAIAIGNVINSFCEVIQDQTDACDPTNITPKDVQNLVFIIGHLSTTPKEDVD